MTMFASSNALSTILSGAIVDLPVTTRAHNATITGTTEKRRGLRAEQLRIAIYLEDVRGIYHDDRYGRGKLRVSQTTQSQGKLVVSSREGSTLIIFGDPIVVDVQVETTPIARRLAFGGSLKNARRRGYRNPLPVERTR